MLEYFLGWPNPGQSMLQVKWGGWLPARAQLYDLNFRRNFTGKMVAKGIIGAGKPNQKFLCVINHLYDIFIDIFSRCTSKPVFSQTKLLISSMLFMLNTNLFYTTCSFFFFVIPIKNFKNGCFYKINLNTPSVHTITHNSQVA